jgi:hypothetical protein
MGWVTYWLFLSFTNSSKRYKVGGALDRWIETQSPEAVRGIKWILVILGAGICVYLLKHII